jgi:hypothetical protein
MKDLREACMQAELKRCEAETKLRRVGRDTYGLLGISLYDAAVEFIDATDAATRAYAALRESNAFRMLPRSEHDDCESDATASLSDATASLSDATASLYEDCR